MFIQSMYIYTCTVIIQGTTRPLHNAMDTVHAACSNQNPVVQCYEYAHALMYS